MTWSHDVFSRIIYSMLYFQSIQPINHPSFTIPANHPKILNDNDTATIPVHATRRFSSPNILLDYVNALMLQFYYVHGRQYASPKCSSKSNHTINTVSRHPVKDRFNRLFGCYTHPNATIPVHTLATVRLSETPPVDYTALSR